MHRPSLCRIVCILLLALVVPSRATLLPFQDPNQARETRIRDLIARLTLPEKVSQMVYDSPAIERLGIPAYNWWNECLHGVARGGRATVFPQTIGLGASFDRDLMRRIGTAVSDEARAIHHAAVARGIRRRYGGLTFWTPNVNIFRDPRWGRGQETYGEDPNLTAQLARAYMVALQGDDPDHLKVAACAKHYAVHSGPEGLRHSFNARVNEHDLVETYLPAFHALVDAGVEAVMCAYNRTNDEPCCGSRTLLGDILRDQWGFQGHILSDCWALVDIHAGHKVTRDATESAALAVNSGVSLNCGNTYPHLLEAVERGLVTEDTIDRALAILLRTRFRLGLFDPPGTGPYDHIGPEVIHSPAHRALAREAARKSVVLLKNDGVLPLRRDIGYLFVTGPSCNNTEVLMGNYYGVSDEMVTLLEGIAGHLDPGSLIQYKHGFLLDRENVNPIDWTSGEAKQADAVVVCLGISPLLEGEEGESIASATKGDRFDLNLPANQMAFLRRLRQNNAKPIVVVLTGGSPISCPELHELADAVLFAWYPGEQGGAAVGDILFGDVSPSGRLPLTFPTSVDQLPPYEDYAMAGRTYRYLDADPLYPFGFGLSYTHFRYTALRLERPAVSTREAARVTVTVRNVGAQAGDEVVQLYLHQEDATGRVPRQTLVDFQRVSLAPGEQRDVRFVVTPGMRARIDAAGNARSEPGRFRLTVGGCSPGTRGRDLGAAAPVTGTLVVQ